MAEIQQSSNSRKRKGVVKAKRLSTRVDLTPMVDLGFLLITFFIFTTTLAESKSMTLVVPDDSNTKFPMTASAERTLTFLIDKEDKVYYYEGAFNSAIKQTSFKHNGVREVIMRKKEHVKNKFNSTNIVGLIKPSVNANYKNIVEVLDEMLINSVSTYMLLDATKEEENAVSSFITN